MTHLLRGTRRVHFPILLVLLASLLLSSRTNAQPAAELLPGPGEPVVNRGVTVTLLGAKRLFARRVPPRKRVPVPGLGGRWPANGLPGGEQARCAARAGPRRSEGALQRSPVQCRHAFLVSPAVVRDTETFLASTFGREISDAVRVPRSSPAVAILDVFIRGDVITTGSSGIVEIEQGETYRPDANGRLRPLSPGEIGASWIDVNRAA
jgi:hypothetical protein